MSHAFYMTQPLIFFPFFHYSNNIWWKYNLWSFTLCSFLQYPITLSHKSLQTDQLYSQTLSQSFLNVTDQVSHPQLQKSYVNTQLFILQ